MDSPLADIRIGQITSQWAEHNHIYVSYQAETHSTNALAKQEAFHENLRDESLCLYLTDHQTGGRGRGNNTWINAQPGSSLLSSWSFLIKTKPQPTVSCLVGLAVYRACMSTWPFLPWNLKAPNDIYIGDKKIAGLLLESLIQGEDVRLIIGLGLNVTSSPKEIKTSNSLLKCLPAGAPLLGQDYLSFLDRLLFELTEAVSHCEEPLSPTDQLSLLTALNQHPLLKEKYTGMKADGSLLSGERQINWSEL
ncbi:MAG: biotin--[acetyl-CoA-carboxylase] ligase [Bdellovibrio sp.]